MGPRCGRHGLPGCKGRVRPQVSGLDLEGQALLRFGGFVIMSDVDVDVDVAVGGEDREFILARPMCGVRMAEGTQVHGSSVSLGFIALCAAHPNFSRPGWVKLRLAVGSSQARAGILTMLPVASTTYAVVTGIKSRDAQRTVAEGRSLEAERRNDWAGRSASRARFPHQAQTRNNAKPCAVGATGRGPVSPRTPLQRGRYHGSNGNPRSTVALHSPWAGLPGSHRSPQGAVFRESQTPSPPFLTDRAVDHAGLGLNGHSPLGAAPDKTST